MVDYIERNKHGSATFVNQRVNQQLVFLITGNEYTTGVGLGNVSV